MAENVTIRLDLLKQIEGCFNKEFGDKLAETIIKEIKSNTSKGISSVTGNKFEPYKDPKKYPGDRKPKNPVNLYLTGKMLDALVCKVDSKKSIVSLRLGWFNKKEGDKYLGNHTGESGAPSRKILPVLGNEDFSSKIKVIIKKLINARVQECLK